MSDDNAKPTDKPAAPLLHSRPLDEGPRTRFLLGVGLKDGKPELLNFDRAATIKALRDDPLHFDKGPADEWRGVSFYHELSHGIGEGTKFLPKLNQNPELEDDLKFTKLTAAFEAKYKRMDKANAMLAYPANEIEMARAECRVTFGEHTTLVDKRPSPTGPWGQPTDSGQVFARMMSANFAANPLEAATAVAIMRSDASPLRNKYNIEL